MVRIKGSFIVGGVLFVFLAAVASANAQTKAPLGPIDVRVVNAPLPVQTPASGAGEVFQTQIDVTVPPHQIFGTNSFNVPSDRRLVIEYVAVRGSGGINNWVEIEFSTTAGSEKATYPLPTTPAANFSNQRVAGQQVKVYADPGTAVSCRLIRSEATEEAFGLCSFSGYLVPAR